MTRLAEVQHAFLETCLAPAPDASALDRLHGPRGRWLVYRDMVRTRFEQMARNGLRRTHATVGAAVFSEAFADYLAEQPPRTRYIREIVAAFVEHAAPRWRGDASLAAHVVDLARYEATCWDVADSPDLPVAPVADFDFDAIPVLGTAHRLLRLEYPVHRKLAAGQAYPSKATALLVYRRPGGVKAEVMSINAVTADLLGRWAEGRETVTESVRMVAAARGFGVDAGFLEKLCSVLADFIDRGVILGSRS